MSMDVLGAVPDLVDIGGATRWFEEQRAALRGLEPSPAVLASFRATEVGRGCAHQPSIPGTPVQKRRSSTRPSLRSRWSAWSRT